MATELGLNIFPKSQETASFLRISVKDPFYGRLSPMYKKDIFLWGLTFPSAAHLYYAQKYIYEGAPPENEAMVKSILSLTRPLDAEQLAGKRKMFYSPWQMKVNEVIDENFQAVPRCDWADVRISAIVLALRAKFAQDEEAAELLRSTEDRRGKPFGCSQRLILKGFPACPLAMEQVRREMLEGRADWAFVPASPFPLQKIMRRR